MTFQEWLDDYWANRSVSERLGQAFCNDFIEKGWPDLYYENTVSVAMTKIEGWLHAHHYDAYHGDKLPSRRNNANV